MDQVSSVSPQLNETSSSYGLVCRDVCIGFDGRDNVLEDLNLQVMPGEIVALVGASGCGKSTLLRAIAGLQPCRAGTIHRAGSESELRREDVSFVFQDPTLLPWRTAFQNVCLPLELRSSRLARKPLVSELNQRVSAALESVNLTADSWNRFPRQLSGGMKMRTSIARALVTEPRLLLLDEPFAALDDLLRTKLNGLLLDLWQLHGQTILFVTHNIAEALWLSHRVAVFGNKKIAQFLDNPLTWPRNMDQRTSLEFARQYGRISQALAEVS